MFVYSMSVIKSVYMRCTLSFSQFFYKLEPLQNTVLKTDIYLVRAIYETFEAFDYHITSDAGYFIVDLLMGS